MIVIIQYKHPLRRWLSKLYPFSVRIFGVDPLKHCKPLGVQRMHLNRPYDIGLTQICFAGKKPKPGGHSPVIDQKSCERHARTMDILQIIPKNTLPFTKKDAIKKANDVIHKTPIIK